LQPGLRPQQLRGDPFRARFRLQTIPFGLFAHRPYYTRCGWAIEGNPRATVAKTLQMRVWILSRIVPFLAASQVEGEAKYYRTGWISDVHLGTRGSNAESLLEFLRDAEFEKLYLVGDLIDIWALRRGIFWPQTHNDVIQKLLRKGRKGTEMIYIVGN